MFYTGDFKRADCRQIEDAVLERSNLANLP